MPTNLGWLDNLEGEACLATPTSQAVNVAPSITSEREVWTFDQANSLKLIADHLVEKLSG
jgi:hypothetical protein